MKRTALKRGRGFGCSPAQREKVAGARCVECNRDRFEAGVPIDPAHLCSRAQGGCDDPLCVVPMCRLCHQAFDGGGLDVLPGLLAWRMVAELQHALGHYDGNLLGLLHRLTGVRWRPESDRAAA